MHKTYEARDIVYNVFRSHSFYNLHLIQTPKQKTQYIGAANHFHQCIGAANIKNSQNLIMGLDVIVIRAKICTILVPNRLSRGGTEAH